MGEPFRQREDHAICLSANSRRSFHRIERVQCAKQKYGRTRPHVVPNELWRLSFGYVQWQGPKLEGLFGRSAGGVADFQQYTAELKASGIVWTDETVDAYLRDPNKLVPSTTMAAWGRVDNADDRKALIAYMRREDRSAEFCPK